MEETSKFVKEEAIQDDDVKLDGVDPVFSNEQDDCSDNADKTEENFKFVKEEIQLQDDEDDVKNNASPVFLQAEAEELAR